MKRNLWIALTLIALSLFGIVHIANAEYVVIRYTNQIAMFNRLESLEVKNDRGRNHVGATSTPDLVDVVTGEMYLTTYLSAEDAGKMPNNDHNPAFAIVWRSSEYDTTDPDNPVWFPWPEAEVNIYDINGNITGTQMQGVPGIVNGYEGE